MACRRQSHGTRWKARCTQYWVKSATSTISRSCRTTGWDATASWSQGCVAHRKDTAAAQDDAQRAQAEAKDEHDVDQEPDEVQRIERSRRRGGQKAREEQAE